MTTGDLRARITRTGLAVVAGLAVAGGLVGGFDGAGGVLAGGAVGIFSFRRLAALVDRVGTAGPADGRLPTLGPDAFRYVATFALLSLVVGTGWAHPLGVAAGVAVLPPLLLVEGLRGGGDERGGMTAWR
jgi:hypothetical protein